MTNFNTLVIGAGPSGLIFALECARKGKKVRIIDKRKERGSLNKATGLAAGAIEWLKPYSFMDEIIRDSSPMKGFVFHDNENLIARVSVPKVDNNPPAYMYQQIDIERHMERELQKYDIQVEYGTEFVSINENSENRLSVKLVTNDLEADFIFDWVIGADGAHSKVRKEAGFSFVGRDYPEEWSVAEITTNNWPDDIQAQLFLKSDGIGLFLSNPTKNTVQGILNSPNVGKQLISKFPGGVVNYERAFKVSLRRVTSPRKNCIWLIGDAAHVQSPVGGQGLNLALWDGVTLAKALLENNLSVESVLAKRAKKVLMFTDFDYRMLSTKSSLIRLFRNYYWKLAIRFPLISKWFFQTISGKW